MKNKKKRKTVPSDEIILNILNQKPKSEEDIIEFYENYIREMATDPVYSEDGSRTGYYYDEDLAQELRIALTQCLPALRNVLIKRHLEDRLVIVVLGHLTD